MIERVVDKFIAELNAQLKERRVVVRLAPAARVWLAKRGFDRLFGARPMARLIQSKIKEALAEELLFGEGQFTGEVLVEEKDDDLVLRLPGHESAPLS